jgi:hypothetical protein
LPAAIGLRAARAFHLLELLAGSDRAAALPQLGKLDVEVGVAQFAAHLGLGDGVLDVLADVVERPHFGIDRQAVELVLNLQPRLRAVHLRQHAILFVLQLLDLGLDLDQRILRLLRVTAPVPFPAPAS